MQGPDAISRAGYDYLQHEEEPEYIGLLDIKLTLPGDVVEEEDDEKEEEQEKEEDEVEEEAEIEEMDEELALAICLSQKEEGEEREMIVETNKSV